MLSAESVEDSDADDSSESDASESESELDSDVREVRLRWRRWATCLTRAGLALARGVGPPLGKISVLTRVVGRNGLSNRSV